MKRTIAIAALLISGCASAPTAHRYTVVQARNDCDRQQAPFELLSGCMQSQMQNNAPEWVLDPDSDLLSVYLSWLAAAGNRVARAELSEMDGRRQAEELRVRLMKISSQRQATARQQAVANALTGFAIMNSAIPTTSSPIVCRTTPTGLGTTMTTCN